MLSLTWSVPNWVGDSEVWAGSLAFTLCPFVPLPQAAPGEQPNLSSRWLASHLQVPPCAQGCQLLWF